MTPTARRGRPATFDRDEGLAAAMGLFWSKGFEGATLEELLEAMGGISAPSLYHAFGSKEELYKEALDLYMATVAAKAGAALEQAPSARAGIEAMLRMAVETFCGPDGPRGCMAQSSAAKCARGNEQVEAYARSVRLKSVDGLKHRLMRAVEQGELSPATDIDGMSAFYTTVAQGLGLRAGDGVAAAEMMAVIDSAMAVWDILSRPPQT